MADSDTAMLRRAPILGALLVVVVGGLSGWLVIHGRQDRAVESTRQLMVSAARQCAANLTTVDHTRAESDVQRILNCATDGFRREFASRSASFIDVVQRSQSTSTGTVTEAGLESFSGAEGVALVAVTVRTVVAGVSDAPPRSLRMRLTIRREGSEARIARVDFAK